MSFSAAETQGARRSVASWLPGGRTRRWRRGVAAIAIVLTACGAEDPVASGRVLSLAVVSGNQQSGKAGHDLPEPFQVRVTDQRGRGRAGVTVRWTVESGEGAFDDRFEMSECPPLGTAATDTDADGLARVSFMPTWFGPSTVAASVSGAVGSPATFTTDASDRGAVLTVVGGNHQQGKTGEPLPAPLWVKVTDGNGQAVPNVSVRWTTTPDRGTLLAGCPWTASWNQAITTARTLSDAQLTGLVSMMFLPRELALGTSTVSASVPGLAASATFTVETATMVIPLRFDGWFNRIYFFPDRVTVPVRMTIEFRNDVPAGQFGFARILSTSVPPGGEPFDSGELHTGGRFEFVPQVTGTWLFVDEVSGAIGELTVR